MKRGPGTFTIAALLLFTAAAASLFAQSNKGEVQIYVFSEEGGPLEGVTVEAEGETYESNASGLLNFPHAPGTHTFELVYEGNSIAQVELPVRQAQVTEAIVTASPSGSDDAGADVATEQADEQSAQEERRELDEDAPTGTLSGTITGVESGEPVANATVIFRGVELETTTNEDGEFSVEVPEGSYSLSIIHPDFSTQTVDGLEVAVGETTDASADLTPTGVQLAEVPVFAVEEVRVQGGIANLIEETRNSSAVVNLIGQEQISRTGDSDAAAALQRVTGLTVVDGRFVFVRGMGERYSSSYINGALLPSPEIDRRVVPLDLFPTGVIESMAIQKTYSPTMLGDFGGGAVRLRTVGIPDDRYRRRLRTTIDASIGWNQGVTLTEALMESQGRWDFLGFDDGSRALPEGIAESDFIIREAGNLGEGFSDQEIEEFGESLPNTWSPEDQLLWPDVSLSISMRDKIELSETSNFGFSGSLIYKQGFDAVQGEDNFYVFEDGEALPNTLYDTLNNTREVDIGGLLDLAYEPTRDLSFDSTSVVVRTTDSEVERYQGFNAANSRYLQVTEQRWKEQMLLSQSLSGTAQLPSLRDSELNGRYTYSRASQDAPDERSVRYDHSSEGFDSYTPEAARWSDRPEAGTRTYTDVTDNIHDIGVDLTVPIFWLSSNSADFLEIGAQTVLRNRDANTRGLWLKFSEANIDADTRDIDDPEELFTEENIGDPFFLQETTIPSDSYTANQQLYAGYLAADLLLFGDLRADIGLRGEYSRQVIDTFDTVTDLPITADVTTADPIPFTDLELPFNLLPALNFTLPLPNDQQLRWGASRTVNRPDFRELAQVPVDKKVGSGQARGNTDLRQAEIYNADLRWEWYIAERETLSLGAFYKYFVDAIEPALIPKAGRAFLEAPVNTPRAQNVGGEIEWQLTLRPISDLIRRGMTSLSFDSLEREIRWRRVLGGVASVFRDLQTYGNFAYIWSEVDYGDDEVTVNGDEVEFTNTSVQRPLVGQSPYVVNASLGYRNSVSWSQKRPVHTSVFLNYNVFGRRIAQLGTRSDPNFYEEPFHQLDLTFKQTFTRVFSIGFKARNLLNLPQEVTFGDQVVESEPKGRSFSFSVKFDL